MSPDLYGSRPLLDKLGVTPGSKVALLDFEDDEFEKELRARTSDVTRGKPEGLCDIVFVGVSSRAELTRIKRAKRWIEPNGAVWVVRPKGPRSEVRDTDVISAGLAAGLVDNKIASFSETHGAMRLVFRIKDRPAAPKK